MDNEDKIVLGVTLGLVILIPSVAFCLLKLIFQRKLL